MTQEDKELLLKDLCARLPYGLIVKETFQEAQRDVSVWDCGPHYIKGHPEKVKPYLRPMSSMTEDEKQWFNALRNAITYQGNDKYDLDDFNELQDFLNRRHLDFRGLIPMGLGIEAPEGMYD